MLWVACGANTEGASNLARDLKESDRLLLAVVKENVVNQDEFQALLEALRGEEEDHRIRLRSLLDAVGSDELPVDRLGAIDPGLPAERGD
jgi:hypothetical protein